jgi:TIR domain
MDGSVFVSYRGEDSHAYGALLYRELSRRFGSDLVFLDSESIPAGADFAEDVLARVRRCRVVLAVIGPGG